MIQMPETQSQFQQVPVCRNGSLAYNSSTGAFTFAPADLSSYSTFSGSYDDLTNKPSILTLNALSAINYRGKWWWCINL